MICEAAKKLSTKKLPSYKVLLTINGEENKYSSDLLAKYKDVTNVQFIGLQKQDNLFELYGKVNCLIFPSKLETWGLPITEFKVTNKPIILADMKYAHETLGEYEKASFFNPEDSDQLAKLMEKEITNTNKYVKHTIKPVSEPFTQNWNELFKIIL